MEVRIPKIAPAWKSQIGLDWLHQKLTQFQAVVELDDVFSRGLQGRATVLPDEIKTDFCCLTVPFVRTLGFASDSLYCEYSETRCFKTKALKPEEFKTRGYYYQLFFATSMLKSG
mmetsp:Transcript_45515/g.62063  ORF Transcript_45515/g.62063 Transcript_45515/m.62063 type:complete len:115 (-) Transcript_45515:76-420(-)